MYFIIGVIIILATVGFMRERVQYMSLNGKIGMFCLLASGVTFVMSLLIPFIAILSIGLLLVVGITVLIALFKKIFLHA